MSVGPHLGHIGRLLASLADSGRLVRGHELVEDGRVRDLVIAAERIEAVVWGSQHQPYEVTIRVPSGTELPTDPRQLRFTCTCPDWGDPCKHAIAVALKAAAELDDNHRLLATLLGGKAAGLELVPESTEAEPEARVGRSLVVATTIAPPRERPSWAQDLVEARAPATLEGWLGQDPGRQPAIPPLDEDPTELLLSLGALSVGDGADLAPSIQLLLYRLAEQD
jgi:uncharacterized Zn finger protein